MINAIPTLLVAVRVLTLILYTGGYLFYVAILNPELIKIPPAHRLLVISETLKRFLYLTWIYIVLTSIAGAIYASDTGLIGTGTGYFLTSANGRALLVEGALTTTMLVSAAVMTFILIPSLSRMNLSVKVSPIDARFKWLSVPTGSEAGGALNRVFVFASLNVIIGVIAILLGILISTGTV